MIGYLIVPLVTLAGAAVILAYWVRRLGREHRERMGELAAGAAAHERAFEAKRREWAEADALAKAEYDARAAALNRELGIPESDRETIPPGG